MIILKKRKLVISRSAHLFKQTLIILACLLSGQANSKIQETYLFRVESTVVGLYDLEVAHTDLEALFCRFPDSLLRGQVNPLFMKKMKEVTQKLKKDSTKLTNTDPEIPFLSSIRSLWKLLNYMSTQEVTINPALEKSVAKVEGCPDINWKKRPIRRSFERWLKLEVYLRSRYAPNGILTTKGWREKRMNSVMLFIDSLDKQIQHENFW